jgi:hypothetical protein
MFKIQLADGEFYKSSKKGRIQHYTTKEQADAKIAKLGDIAAGATVVESKARTAAAKTEKSEETASDAKAVKVSKTKKASAKPEKTDESESGKAKKPKKNKNT